MPRPVGSLRVLVWDRYTTSTRQLVADLTGRITRRFEFSTALHGGFKDAYLYVPMSLSNAWLTLNRENLPGWHFHHVEILEDTRKVWEGRIMDVALDLSGEGLGVNLTAMGYWSSMRDQYYDADDTGNTNWKIGGPHNVGKVIRELITKECPDINGTADVTLTSRDIAGIDLTGRAYPMDHILDRLAPLADSDGKVYYFAVWDDRKPTYAARSAASVDWYVWLRDLKAGRLEQQGKHLRNSILPVIGTAEGTSTIDSESTGDYPLRELIIKIGTGVPNAAANDARDVVLAERKFPRQDQQFTIDGHIYSANLAGLGTGLGAASGAMAERPKWWVRAGQVIRIQDLVPASQSSPAFDDLRTFYILETRYDALNDVLTVQPDRAAPKLTTLMARLGALEFDR